MSHMQRDLTQPVSTPDAGTERSSTLTAPLCSFLVSALLAVSLAGCGGGGSGPGSSLNDGFGPGNPSSCPKAQLSDAWFNNRLGCLANDQRFISGAAADGAPADRAYIFGQQVLDGRLNDVLGANVLRYFKFALCVRNAPANVAPSALAGALATALGLNAWRVRQHFSVRRHRRHEHAAGELRSGQASGHRQLRHWPD